MGTLKEFREQKGVKQTSVAQHLGVTRQTYANYEDNQESMSIGQARAVCDFLGVPVEQIFCLLRLIKQTSTLLTRKEDA